MGVLTILFNTENSENDHPADVRQRVSSVWASGSDKKNVYQQSGESEFNLNYPLQTQQLFY